MCEAHRTEHRSAAAENVSGLSVRVDDMTCGHCAATIKEAIENTIPGAKVSADPERRQVSVEGADLARVREIITAAGYTPDSVAA